MGLKRSGKQLGLDNEVRWGSKSGVSKGQTSKWDCKEVKRGVRENRV